MERERETVREKVRERERERSRNTLTHPLPVLPNQCLPLSKPTHKLEDNGEYCQDMNLKENRQMTGTSFTTSSMLICWKPHQEFT